MKLFNAKRYVDLFSTVKSSLVEEQIITMVYIVNEGCKSGTMRIQ